MGGGTKRSASPNSGETSGETNKRLSPISKPQCSHPDQSNPSSTQDPYESYCVNETYASKDLKYVIHGNEYQLKLLMLFACVANNLGFEFELATEMSSAEKFNDIVLRYTDKTNKVKYRFLQVKHRISEDNFISVSDLKSKAKPNDRKNVNPNSKQPKSKKNSAEDGGDFSLSKYFISYLRITDNTKFRDGEIQDFVICTNIGFNFERRIQTKLMDTWRQYLQKVDEQDEILNIGGEIFRFNKGPSVRSKIIDELQMDFEDALKRHEDYRCRVGEIRYLIDRYLDSLKFVVNLPSGNDLKKIIQEKIGGELNLITEATYSSFYLFMSEWLENYEKKPNAKGMSRYLKNKDVTAFLKHCKEKLNGLVLKWQSDYFSLKINKCQLRFSDESEVMKKICGFFNDVDKRILIVEQRVASLTLKKIVQYFDCPNDGINQDGLHFVRLHELVSVTDSKCNLVEALKSGGKVCLVAVQEEKWNSPSEEVTNELLQELKKVVLEDCNKRIIFICSGQDCAVSLLESHFQELFIKLEDSENFVSLTADCQQYILQNFEVTFQKKKVTLENLVSRNVAADLINEEVLNTIGDGEDLEIGSKPVGLSDLESIKYYIGKKISQEQLKRAVESYPGDIFVIFRDEGTENVEFLENINIHCLTTDNNIEKVDFFTEKSENQPNCVIHVIEFCSSSIIWKFSYDPNLYMERNFYPKVVDVADLKKLMENNNRDEADPINVFIVLDFDANDFESIYSIKTTKIGGDIMKLKYSVIIHSDDEIQALKSLQERQESQQFNLHWLKDWVFEEKHFLIWLHSEGNIDELKKLLAENTAAVLSETDIQRLTKDENVVIIADEPGMGKSTSSIHLFKDINDTEWLIRFDLKSVANNLESNVAQNRQNVLEKFLIPSTVGLNNKISRKLLAHRMENEGHLTLIFDGFDELSSNRQNNLIKILQILKNTKAKIWITTRKFAKNLLEDTFLTPSYTFQPLSKNSQKQLLVKFWTLNAKLDIENSLNLDILQRNVNEIFNTFCQNIHDQEGALLNTPLLTRMFAEVHQKNILHRQVLSPHVSVSLSQGGQSPILNLYREFIKKKYNIFFNEKMSLNNLSGSLRRKLIRTLNKNHQQLALKKLFPADLEGNCLKLLFYESSGEEEPEHEEEDEDQEPNNLELIGLVQSINNDEEFHFIHLTFAEYFAAKFFYNVLRREKSASRDHFLHETVLKNIFLKRYRGCRSFLEELLKNHGRSDLMETLRELLDCYFRGDENKDLIRLNPDISAANMNNSLDYDNSDLLDLKKRAEQFFYRDYQDKLATFSRLFQLYFEETNLLKIQDVANFLALKLGNDTLEHLCDLFLENGKIFRAVAHYMAHERMRNSPSELSVKSIIRNLVDSVRCVHERRRYALASSMCRGSAEEIFEFWTRFRTSGTMENSSDFLETCTREFYRNIMQQISLHIEASVLSNSDFRSLERQGMWCAGSFEVLTPRMADKFCSILNRPIHGWRVTGFDEIYADRIWSKLIVLLLTKLGKGECINVDESALLKMILNFTKFHVKNKFVLKMSTDNLNVVLKLLECELGKSDGHRLAKVLLDRMWKGGIMMVSFRDKLLVIDRLSGINKEWLGSKLIDFVRSSRS